MSQQRENKDSIRSYLLGELSEQERERIEQRLLSDEDFYQELLFAEDDLIDEFVAGALPETERTNFTGRFLQVPELRQDVRFALALREHALKSAPQPAGEGAATPRASLLGWLRQFFMRPVVGISFAGALLATVLLAAWLGLQNSQLRKQIGQLQAQQTSPTSQQDLQEQLAGERLRNEQLSAELLREQERRLEEERKTQEAKGQPQPTPARSPAPPETGTVMAFTLTPGLVRESGTLKKLSVPSGAREVIFRLDLAANDYRSYRAVLKTVEGREVLSRQALRASGGKFVPMNIPATLLTPNDYQIQLSGVNSSGESEEVSSYYFRVLK